MILITGGARSGKSRHAESLIQSFASVLYIATSAAIDDEMAARIQHHRNSRPPHWRTAERSRDLTPLITPDNVPDEAILLECVTTLVTNILFAEGGETDLMNGITLRWKRQSRKKSLS